MRKGTKNLSPEDAREVYQMYIMEGAKAAKKLCEIKGYKKTTYYKIVNQEGVVVRPEASAYSHDKWDEQQIDTVIDYIEDGHPQATLAELLEEFCDRRGYPRIPLATLWRYLDGRLITYKEVQQWNQERNSDKTKEMRAEYAQWFMHNQDKSFVFIDEFGFNLNTIRRFGRGKSGARVPVNVARNKGTNVSVMMAVCEEHGLLLARDREGSMTAEDFEVFLSILCDAIRDHGMRNVIIVYDNCSIHREDIANQMAWYGDWDYTNLPPYSPMLNPIEECIGDVKNRLKTLLSTTFRQRGLKVASLPFGQKTAQRLAILREALEQSLPVLTPEKVQSHYRHSLSFIPDILEKKDV